MRKQNGYLNRIKNYFRATYKDKLMGIICLGFGLFLSKMAGEYTYLFIVAMIVWPLLVFTENMLNKEM